MLLKTDLGFTKNNVAFFFFFFWPVGKKGLKDESMFCCVVSHCVKILCHKIIHTSLAVQPQVPHWSERWRTRAPDPPSACRAYLPGVPFGLRWCLEELHWFVFHCLCAIYFFPLNLRVCIIYVYIYWMFLPSFFFLLPRPVVLNLRWASDSPRRPHSQSFWFIGLGQGPRISTANKFQVTLMLLVWGPHLRIAALD